MQPTWRRLARLMASHRGWRELIGTGPVAARPPLDHCSFQVQKSKEHAPKLPSALSQCPTPKPNHSARRQESFLPPSRSLPIQRRSPRSTSPFLAPTSRGLHMHSWLGELFGDCSKVGTRSASRTLRLFSHTPGRRHVSSKWLICGGCAGLGGLGSFTICRRSSAFPHRPVNCALSPSTSPRMLPLT
jgi:hypothetical protein